MKKILVIILFFIFSLILLPKEFLYFKLEHILKQQNILINETIESKIDGIILKDGVVYVNGMDLVKFSKLDLDFLYLYSNIKISNLYLDREMIKDINIKYSILNPTKIFINSEKLKGEIDLVKRKIVINSSLNIIKQFSKSGKYETNF